MILPEEVLYRIATDPQFEPHEAYRSVVELVVACCG
jgi:hypothetical protein